MGHSENVDKEHSHNAEDIQIDTGFFTSKGEWMPVTEHLKGFVHSMDARIRDNTDMVYELAERLKTLDGKTLKN